MTSSKFLTVFLLLALIAALVNAQNATNEIDECIKRENCAPNDRECRAACAGVPDPDPKVAEDTRLCYEKCANDTLPQNEDAYKTCINDCKEDIYQEGVTEPGSAAPSKSGQKGGDSESGSDDGKSESGGTSNDSESSDNESDNGNDTEKDGGARFSATSVHVYVFAAVIACVAFTVGL